jgi:hypothetical protein
MKNLHPYILVTVLSLSGLVFSTGLAQTATLLPALSSTDKILTIDPALLTVPVTTVAPAITTPPATTSTPPVDSTTTTTGTTPTGNGTDGTVVTGTTVIPDRTTTITPTTGQTGTTAPAGTIPPRTTQNPPATTTGTSGGTPDIIPPDTQTPPAEACPPINPLATGQTECPKTEKVPVIPQIPYLLVATPLLGALLFLLIFSALNRRQGKLENRLQQRHLSAEHQKTVSASRNSLYLDLLDQVSAQLGSAQGMDGTSLQKFSSRIELLGSPEVQALSQKLTASLAGKDRGQTKSLLKDLALQIRKEL